MIRLFLLLTLTVSFTIGDLSQTLIDCEISKPTIDGVQNVINEHSSMIQMVKSNRRAKKTEVDSMKADIDFYLEENAPDEDKKKWMDCVTRKVTASPTE